MISCQKKHRAMNDHADNSEKKQISPTFDPLKDSASINEHLERIKGATSQKKDILPHKISLPSHLEETVPLKLTHKQYAFGIWRFVVKNEFVALDGIYRDGFLGLLHELGFRKRYRPDNTYQYILEKKNILKAVELSQIRDAITDVVKTAEDIKKEHHGLSFEATAELQKETFFRSSPSLLNDAVLGHLTTHSNPTLKDTAEAMFFPFRNCLAKITKDGASTMDYSELNDMCIWHDHIIHISFIKSHDYAQSQYAKFINNVAGGADDRIRAFHSAIGYLLHNHSAPTTARAVIAYDEEISKKNQPQGGSGKGIFNQALMKLRSVAVIDGKKVRPDSQFSYQQVTERTQIISFDDVKSDFDFLMLNSNLTTGWQIEHKHKPAFRFSPKENPKTYITSNTILKAEGSTAQRRQFILEFSPYYLNLVRQNIEPIVHVHGGIFFSDDWDEGEWNRFYSFMLDCCRYYLEVGLQFHKPRALAKNKLLQQTTDDFVEWVQTNPIIINEEFDINQLFNDFKNQYYGGDVDFRQRTFTNWLKKYATTINSDMQTRRSSGKTYGKFIPK